MKLTCQSGSVIPPSAGREGGILVDARAVTGVVDQVLKHDGALSGILGAMGTAAKQSQLRMRWCPVLGIGVAVLRPEEHRQECLCYPECRDDFESKNVGSKALSTVEAVLRQDVCWTLLIRAQRLGVTDAAGLA